MLATHTPEKPPAINPRESPSNAPFGLTRQNSLAVFVKEDYFNGPEIAVLPKESSPSTTPRALTRQNSTVVFVEKDFFAGPQIVVLPKESSPSSEAPLLDDKGIVRKQFAGSNPWKATHRVPKPRGIPCKDIVERLGEAIDETLEDIEDHNAKQLSEISRLEENGTPVVPESAGFLQDQSRYTESPKTMSPSIGKGGQYNTRDHSFGSKGFKLPTSNLRGSKRKRCIQRSVTMGPLRSSSESEDYVKGHSAINELEMPRAYSRTQAHHPHRNSIHLDSIGTANLFQSQSHSNPGPIRAPLKKLRIDRGSFNIYIGHQRDHSIITSPDPNSSGGKEQRPEQNKQPSLGSRRSNGSMRSNASTRSWMPSLKWRWWKLVLVDIEPPRPRPPPSKTGSVPTTDKGSGEGGTTDALTLNNQDGRYESEKELAKEILSVLAHPREVSNDASDIFAEEIRASRSAYTLARDGEEQGESKKEEKGVLDSGDGAMELAPALMTPSGSSSPLGMQC